MRDEAELDLMQASLDFSRDPNEGTRLRLLAATLRFEQAYEVVPPEMGETVADSLLRLAAETYERMMEASVGPQGENIAPLEELTRYRRATNAIIGSVLLAAKIYRATDHNHEGDTSKEHLS